MEIYRIYVNIEFRIVLNENDFFKLGKWVFINLVVRIILRTAASAGIINNNSLIMFAKERVIILKGI